MSPAIQALSTFAHWFGAAVNLVGATVLLSRIALHLLPKARAGDTTSRYARFLAFLWHASLSVGHLNSQL